MADMEPKQPVAVEDGCSGVDVQEEEPGLLSVGSRLHAAGKCKPCVFFHTKGCDNGRSCTFCHECPPQEAERRKRVKRQLARSRRSPAAADELAGLGKAGHLRQGSSTSTTASAGNGGAHLVLSHSRQSSGAFSLDSSTELLEVSEGQLRGDEQCESQPVGMYMLVAVPMNMPDQQYLQLPGVAQCDLVPQQQHYMQQMPQYMQQMPQMCHDVRFQDAYAY
eukprot:gb/GFBE01075031.1/.p1 GENE.gb/GFBE01075031.1/~~gb/GFBE01075031.1/.p1  ORF type:complete len:221 (+),score=51.44 gb/GFBE01075031.1/:1-663(+)